MIFFVKLVWKELLEAKIFLLIPTQPELGPSLSDSCTCHFWTPGGATDNTAQTLGFETKFFVSRFRTLFCTSTEDIVIFQMKAFHNQKHCGVEE